MANPNPSPETRFQPGNRANPGGRPRAKPLTDALRRVLDLPAGEAFVPETNLERAAWQWFQNVMDGDLGSLKEALNRIEGKTPDRVIVDERGDDRRIRIGRRPRPGDPGDGASA